MVIHNEAMYLFPKIPVNAIQIESDIEYDAYPVVILSDNCVSFDRRALLTTHLKPLSNSLYHLSTNHSRHSSIFLRRVMEDEGGVALLVNIARRMPTLNHPLASFSYTATLQTLCNLCEWPQAENIHHNLVQSGIFEVLKELLVHLREAMKHQPQPSVARSGLGDLSPDASPLHPPSTLTPSLLEGDTLIARQTLLETDFNLPSSTTSIYRLSHILMCVRILAVLSEYPNYCDQMRVIQPRNLFALIQVFCGPSPSEDLQRFAIQCLRNAFRRGLWRPSGEDANSSEGWTAHRCGNLACQAVETKPKTFSRCPRCHKVFYCRYVRR